MSTRERDPDPDNSPGPTRQGYDAAFRALNQGGRVMTDCYLAAFGDDALIGADPFSAIALSELRWLLETARLTAGQIVVDLGCGRGGPGLVAARLTDVRLIGVDFSLVGVAAATARAAESGVAPLPLYVGCDARALPFPDHSIDAFMSIDVLQLIPDRELVFQEVARVLRPGGPLAFSSWERTADDERVPPKMRRVPRDYTELVGRNHLRMKALEISEKSHQRSEAFWSNVTASADEIRNELGEEVASEILDEASRMGVFLAASRRVLCVAHSSS